MTPGWSATPTELLDIAIDWQMQLRAAPDSETLHRAVAAWRAAAPAHEQAWRQAERSWQLLGEALPAVTPPRRARRRWRLPTAAALAACLLLALAPSLVLNLRADAVTGAGETRLLTLADGSVVHLGADSALAVDMNGPRREAQLLRGQAYFEVAPDAARPFIVHTGSLQVSVLGTAFDVRVGRAATTVAVAHGAVGVQGAGAALPLAERLAPGDRLRYDHALRRFERDSLPPALVAAWRDGRLSVQDVPVIDVVETLQRYRAGRIVLADDSLAGQRVTGSYDLRHPQRALEAVVLAHHGRLRQLSPLLTWVDAAP